MKLTEEDWDYSKQEGVPGHCVVAQIFCGDDSMAFVEPTEDSKIASSRAHFISLIPEIATELNFLVDFLEKRDIAYLRFDELKLLTQKLNYEYEL